MKSRVVFAVETMFLGHSGQQVHMQLPRTQSEATRIPSSDYRSIWPVGMVKGVGQEGMNSVRKIRSVSIMHIY